MVNFNFPKDWGGEPIGGGGAIAHHAPMVATALVQVHVLTCNLKLQC